MSNAAEQFDADISTDTPADTTRSVEQYDYWNLSEFPIGFRIIKFKICVEQTSTRKSAIWMNTSKEYLIAVGIRGTIMNIGLPLKELII